MRIVPVLFSALVFSSALAQSLPWPVTHSGAMRLTAYDLAVDGGEVWTAAGWGVVHQHAVEGSAPDSGTSVAVPGLTSTIAARDGRAWAGSGSVLYTMAETSDGLVIEDALPLEGIVNDLLLHGDYLYAGTSTALLQIDLLNPSRPQIARELPTSSGGVVSLARRGDRLFAVDGDVSVDIYNISIPSVPQRTSELNVFPRNATVSIAADSILVSDGRQTRIFAPGETPSFVGTLPTGVDAAVDLGNRLAAVASGRQVRIWDLTTPASAALLWTTSTPVTDGSVNRATSIALAAGALIAASGDGGQLAWNVDDLVAPYATLAWRSAAVTSIVTGGDVVITGLAGGGMEMWRRVSGGLDRRGSFEETATWSVADVDSGRFIAFSGTTLGLWSHSTLPPQKVATAQLPAGARAAVLRDSKAWVLLTNGTAVTVDFTTSQPLVQPWDAGVQSPYGVAAAGDRMAVIGLSGSESVVRVHTIGGPSTAPVTIPGSASVGFTVDSSGRVAALTFAGLHLIDPEGDVRVVPDLSPASDLEIAGEELVLLRGDELEIRGWDDGQVRRTVRMPGSFEVTAPVQGTGQVVLAGETMVGVARIDAAAGHPVEVSAGSTNRFPRDLMVEEEWVYVRESRRMVKHRLSPGGSLTAVAWFDVPGGVVDLVVVEDTPFALDNVGRITRLDWRGEAKDSVELPRGGDFVALDLESVGGALHASYRRGCSEGACEKRTEVLDPDSLDITASLEGGVIASTVSGDTAYVITDLPRAIRRLDVSDPLHPVVTTTRLLDEDFVSVAWDVSRSAVWILGDRLVRLDPVSLATQSEFLEPWEADEGGQLSYNDQEVRVNGGVLIVSGRAPGPAIWVDGNPAGTPAVWATPAAARRMEPLRDGIIVMTDSSIEIALTPRDQIRRGVRR